MSAGIWFPDGSGVVRKARKVPLCDLSGVQRSSKAGWLGCSDGVVRKVFSRGVAYTVTYYKDGYPNADMFKYTAVFAEPVLVQPTDYVSLHAYSNNTYQKRLTIDAYFSDYKNKGWWDRDYSTDKNPILYENFGYKDFYGDTLTVPAHLTKVEITLYYRSAYGTVGNTLAGILSVGGHTCDLTQNGEIIIP